MHHKNLLLRTAGFLISLLLSILAYFIIVYPESFHLKPGMAINVIFALAILQSIAQLIFFLDLAHEKAPRWNLGVFVSTLSIIIVVVFFSIWIMDNLNYNMMPLMSLSEES